MAKKRNEEKKSVTAQTIGDYTITINQFLHGIEVKGKKEDGTVPIKEDTYLRSKGFWFSKRKKHYWRDFNGEVYEAVVKHYTEQSKRKAKAKKDGAEEFADKTLGEAVPINVAEAFKDRPKAKAKSTAKKQTAKTTTKTTTKAKAKSNKKSEPTLEEWRDQLLKQTEAMVNSAYDLLKQGKALA